MDRNLFVTLWEKGSTLFFTIFLLAFPAMSHAEWNFGIGTGPHLLAVKGDAGFDTDIAPVQLDVDLDFEDMSDLTDSAIGFGGYATDGKWMIKYVLGKLELEADAVKGFRTGATLNADVEFDYTQAELTIGYPILKNSSYTIRGYSGLRYLRQELDIVIVGTGFAGIDRQKNIDESWTDLLFGISADVPFADKWNWNIKTDAGFGGSEGTYLLSTGVTWRFYGNWSGTLSADYVAVNYENGSKGSSDWYMYDVDETIVGLVVLYNW